MQLPTWLPKRFRQAFADNPPSPHHPHYERLRILVLEQESEMKNVWPVLEKKAKPASKTLGKAHPLDAFLMAAQADLWGTAGLEVQETKKAAENAKSVCENMSNLRGSLNAMLREFSTEETRNPGIIDLIRSAEALGIDSQKIEEPGSEPDYLESFLSKLPELEAFFNDFSEALEGLTHRVNKQGTPDKQALFLARALKKCTANYFTRALHSEIATTIQTITGRPYDPERLKHLPR